MANLNYRSSNYGECTVFLNVSLLVVKRLIFPIALVTMVLVYLYLILCGYYYKLHMKKISDKMFSVLLFGEPESNFGIL